MRIVATSDLHGHLPLIPECDLLIIAGDVCPIEDHTLLYQWDWLERIFGPWLASLPAKHIVGIAGNHDHIFAEQPESVVALELPWTYLRDSETVVDGLKLYGLPWIPNLPGWAFYAPSTALGAAYSLVPADTDLVISHGPPHGILDNTVRQFGTGHANEMLARVNPRLFVCGHIHEGFGHHRVGDTDIYNVAHMDRTYTPVNKPVVIDFTLDGQADG